MVYLLDLIHSMGMEFKMRKYRIIKEAAYTSYTVERWKDDRWGFVCFKDSVKEAEKFCNQMIQNQETILIKEFCSEE